MKDQYQNIYVTLSSGKVGLFSGPVLVTAQDQTNNVAVTDIKFSEPKDLPEGMNWERKIEEQGK